MELSKNRPARAAFTLLELLTVIAIIGVLAALVLPLYNLIFKRSHQMAALSNMRQVGLGFMLYAGENNYLIPGRVRGEDAAGKAVQKWPHVLQPYVQDLHVFGAPLDDTNGQSYKVANVNDYLDDEINNTSFISNGYNDLGAFEDASVNVRINVIDHPAQVIMLGTPSPRRNNFYMDFKEGKVGNNKNVLNIRAFGNGSNYFFTDGSSRFLKAEDNANLTAMQKQPESSDVYSDWLWLVDKSKTDIIR